jgi:RHS repeat-associated protein
LGNIREVWRAAGFPPAGTVQYTQYYPSGLPWASNSIDNPITQPYKYNGKEFVEMHGYDMYDYGARGYYAAMGRFTSVDPLAEKYYSISPYAYCAGNPIRFIDPDGRGLFDNIVKFGKEVLKSLTVNTSIGFQVGVKTPVIAAKANVVSLNLGGVANGKSTFNVANPSLTQEATVKIATVGVSVKKEVKDIGNDMAQKTTSLSASAGPIEAEHKETQTYTQNNNGTSTELSSKKENDLKVPDSSYNITAIVGVEVTINWEKAAKALNEFIKSVQDESKH